MAELNWTLEAEQWLRDIYDHIAEDNPIAAAGVIEGIYERAQVLLGRLANARTYRGFRRCLSPLVCVGACLAHGSPTSTRESAVVFGEPECRERLIGPYQPALESLANDELLGQELP